MRLVQAGKIDGYMIEGHVRPLTSRKLTGPSVQTPWPLRTVMPAKGFAGNGAQRPSAKAYDVFLNPPRMAATEVFSTTEAA